MGPNPDDPGLTSICFPFFVDDVYPILKRDIVYRLPVVHREPAEKPVEPLCRVRRTDSCFRRMGQVPPQEFHALSQGEIPERQFRVAKMGDQELVIVLPGKYDKHIPPDVAHLPQLIQHHLRPCLSLRRRLLIQGFIVWLNDLILSYQAVLCGNNIDPVGVRFGVLVGEGKQCAGGV